MACLSLYVPDGEFDELLEHVPLSARRKLLLSPSVSFQNQLNSLDPFSLAPCSAQDQVDQHFPKDGPNHKVTAGACEVVTNEDPVDSSVFYPGSQHVSSCHDVGLPLNSRHQGHQADELPGTEANADAPGLEINARVFLSPNRVPSHVPDVIKAEFENMLPSLSKNDTTSSATTGFIAYCQDVDSPINVSSQGSEFDQLKGSEADASILEKINIGVPVPPNPLSSNVSTFEKVDCADTKNSTGVIVMNTMDKKLGDFTFDELDHIVLKERRKLLLKRKLMEFEKAAVESSPMGLKEDTADYSTKRIKQELQPIDGECITAQNQFNDFPIRNAADYSSCSHNGSSSLEYSAWRNKEKHQYVNGKSWSGIESDRSGKRMGESSIICPSERTSTEFRLRDGYGSVPAASTNNIYNSTLNTSVKVKVEPLYYNNSQNSERNTLGNVVSVKCEEDISDVIDHMLLRDRMKLLTSFEDLKSNSSSDFEFLGKSEPDASGFSPFVSEPAKPTTLIRPRRRKKTATDSVTTALEEDAPGLLKVLLDQGVSVDEIKLYGESENDEALDESFNEDSFSELEGVMTKLFSQRSHFFKFASVGCTKGAKPSYCLACLFSLVEQTRYLQFRKWPVEWGWCRDLQSFIFVFKRHHRIVLERPEYGYATYFFELFDSLPIGWQVKRMVTIMKLTNCGRITLIENKPLSVGEDLTEGEAQVLMEYGWVPNTGLGTMLNYRDRVVHDRKSESSSSEWRSKIGRLLIDAYNSGTIVSASVVEDATEEDGNVHLKFQSFAILNHSVWKDPSISTLS